MSGEVYDADLPYDADLAYGGVVPSMAELISKPASRRVFLAEITAGLECAGWVLTSGKTITYQLATTANITEVRADDVALTLQTSVNDVEANPRSYYFSGSILYVSMATGTPFDFTVMATVYFRFSTEPKIFNHIPYRGLLQSIPTISMRIEERFGGVGQVGDGDVTLINNSGYFDPWKDLVWAYGRVRIKMGVDFFRAGLWVESQYEDYVTLGTWLVENGEANDTEFRLQLRDVKSRLQKNIPLEVFTAEDYPMIDRQSVGKPIPRVWGQVYGTKPILIDAGAKRFKSAGHSVFSFESVKIKIDDVWTDSAFVSRDEDNGEFVLGADWENGREVSVDLIGAINPDGTPMLNAADIVADLLNYLGETDQNLTAFATARARLDLGPNNDGQRTTIRKPAIYLDATVDGLEVLGKINDLVGSFLIPDADGQWSYTVWEPQPGEGLQQFDERSSLTLDVAKDVTGIFTKIAARYATRKQEEYSRLAQGERLATQYAHNLKSAKLIEKEIMCSDPDDAESYAQRQLIGEGMPVNRLRASYPHTAFLVVAGQQIRVTDTRQRIDEVIEVLQVSANFTGSKTNLTCTRLREYGRRCGFWVDDAAVLPERFAAEAGYGSGSLVWNPLWSDAIAAWARQNVGYWTDENGFACTADPRSLTSKWI